MEKDGVCGAAEVTAEATMLSPLGAGSVIDLVTVIFSGVPTALLAVAVAVVVVVVVVVAVVATAVAVVRSLRAAGSVEATRASRSISRGLSPWSSSTARSRPSFLGKLMTPSVKCSDPGGLTASAGSKPGPRASGVETSARRAERTRERCGRDEGVARGMQRKCVSGGFDGAIVGK